MAFEKQITDKLVEKKLSESSIKLYMRNLRKLNDGEPIKNFKFLSNVENIMKKIQPLKDNTKKGYLISIVSVLNCFLTTKASTVLCNKYYTLMKEIQATIKQTPSDAMSKQQSENWLDWSLIVKKWEDLKAEAVEIGKKKEINLTQYNTMLSFVILSLYVLIPPRRNLDWAVMRIKKNVVDTDDKKTNYLDWDEQKFIFNVYKTASTYHQEKIDIPVELKACIEQYLKFHPNLKKGKITKDTDVMFLIYQDEKDLTSINAITRILNKVFDKKIGSSMLRHIFLTHKFGKDKEEREKIAKEMGHSVATQGEYIKNVE